MTYKKEDDKETILLEADTEQSKLAFQAFKNHMAKNFLVEQKNVITL